MGRSQGRWGAAGRSCRIGRTLGRGRVELLERANRRAELPDWEDAAARAHIRECGWAKVKLPQLASWLWSSPATPSPLAGLCVHLYGSSHHVDMGRIRPCLVSKKFYKIFQILCHIESLDACMEY